MFVEGLVALLTNNAGLQGVLGTPASRSDGSTGIYANVARDETNYPYLVYTQVSRRPATSMAGVNRWQEARFRFFCYGSSYAQAKTLAEKLKLLLDGFTGQLADSQQTIVQSCWPNSEADDPEPMFHGTTYGVHLDFTFQFIDAS